MLRIYFQIKIKESFEMNYLDNAENLLKQKKRDFGYVTDQLEKSEKEKPEADIVDIKTGKKLEGH